MDASSGTRTEVRSLTPFDSVDHFLSLINQGMTEAEEDKLLALKDFMLKSNKAKANMGEQSHLVEAGQTGVIDLATLGISGRQVDLVKPKTELEDKRGNHLTQCCKSATCWVFVNSISLNVISGGFF